MDVEVAPDTSLNELDADFGPFPYEDRELHLWAERPSNRGWFQASAETSFSTEGVRQRRPEQRFREQPRTRGGYERLNNPYNQRRLQSRRERIRQSRLQQQRDYEAWQSESAAETVELLPRRQDSHSVDISSGSDTSASNLDLRLGANSAAASSIPKGVAAVAGAGVAGLVGAVTVASLDSSRDSGYTLPGTEYVGPGNPIKEGPARHGTDQVARDHDIGYRDVIANAKAGKWSEATFRSAIRALDVEASEAFWREYNTEGKWQALVGNLGLRAKVLAEDVVGQIYPSVPGKSRWLSLLESLRTIGLIGRE